MALRRPVVVLNELSIPHAPHARPDDEIASLIARFAELLRDVDSIRSDVSLASSSPLPSHLVTSDGRTLGAFVDQHGGRLKESWRYIKRKLNRSEMNFSLVERSQLEEWLCAGEPCVGLGFAAQLGQLSLSWQTAECWDAQSALLTRRTLVEDKDGTLSLSEQEVTIAHASRVDHLRAHELLVREAALDSSFCGADLWEDRLGLYPRLRFIPRVREQLWALGYGNPSLKSVHSRLLELNAAMALWDPGKSAFPAWQSHVTPESETRKRLCAFVDEDGRTYTFDLHARYTPGAGRIHFRLDTTEKAPLLRVAHLGHKL